LSLLCFVDWILFQNAMMIVMQLNFHFSVIANPANWSSSLFGIKYCRDHRHPLFSSDFFISSLGQWKCITVFNQFWNFRLFAELCFPSWDHLLRCQKQFVSLVFTFGNADFTFIQIWSFTQNIESVIHGEADTPATCKLHSYKKTW
jgi:hypothetical protein